MGIDNLDFRNFICEGDNVMIILWKYYYECRNIL